MSKFSKKQRQSRDGKSSQSLNHRGTKLIRVLLIPIAATAIAGAWRVQTFIKTELTPLATTSISQTLNRPIHLGEVKGFSLTHITFGSSSIPPTTTDTDKAVVESVEVKFNLWELLADINQRRLGLTVTLVNPDVYLEQNQAGSWIDTKIKPAANEGVVKVALEKLIIRNAQLTLAPKANQPQQPTHQTIAFAGIQGSIQLLQNNQLIKFTARGNPKSGGEITINGDLQPQTLNSHLHIRSPHLSASDITDIISLPLNFPSGTVSGDLQIKLTPHQPALLFGKATLKGVSLKLPQAPTAFLNTEGNITFQGTQIQLEKLTGQYGKIPLVATGTIDTQKGYQLFGQVPSVSFAHVQQTLNIPTTIPVTAELQSELKLVGSLAQPTLSGAITTVKPPEIDKVDFTQITTVFDFRPHAELVEFRNIKAKVKAGGEITGDGSIKLAQEPQSNLVNFTLTSANLSGDAIAQKYGAVPTVMGKSLKLGNITAKAKITGRGDKVETVVNWQAPQATYAAKGETVITTDKPDITWRNVSVNVNGGVVKTEGKYTEGKWEAIARSAHIPLAPFLNSNPHPALAQAQFNGSLTLTGDTTAITSITPQQANITLPGGNIAITHLQLQKNNFYVRINTNNLPLKPLTKHTSNPIVANLKGTIEITGKTDNPSLDTITATGQASLTTNQGSLVIPRLEIAKGYYQAQLRVNNIPINQFATIPPSLQGTVDGVAEIGGSLKSFAPETIRVSGAAQVKTPTAQITASKIQVANGRYQTSINAVGKACGVPNLGCELQGNVTADIAGVVGSTSLADITTTAQVQLPQGIPSLPGLLTANLIWDGQKLKIPTATAPGLQVSGDISVHTQTAIPTIKDLNLTLQARNYNLQNLQNLQSQESPLMQITGGIDFDGQITGNLSAPHLQGKLGLRNLTLENIPWEPWLVGDININTHNINQINQEQSIKLDIAGNQDRIAVNLNRKADGTIDFESLDTLVIQWRNTLVTAVGEDEDNLSIKVANLPIDVFSAPILPLVMPTPNLTIPEIAGTLDGDLSVNKKTLTTSGSVSLASPKLGSLTANSLSAEFGYDDGKVEITKSELTKGKSSYNFVGNIAASTELPVIEGKFTISEGEIRDLLTVVEMFNSGDKALAMSGGGRAEDLIINTEGLGAESLSGQLEIFNRVVKQANTQKPEASDEMLTMMMDAGGTFAGEVSVNTGAGLSASFDLRGENVHWAKVEENNPFDRADRVVAQGSWSDGVLQFRPLRLELGESVLTFSGNLGGTRQSGQLRVSNFPIALLNDFVTLPVDISGMLNGSAALAGSVTNPQSQGELQISDGTLNGEAVKSAIASFSYANGRLNISSNVAVVATEPIQITGSIPYQLPLPGSVTADNNNIDLDIEIKNEGLGILNLFTEQVKFTQGRGEVDITIRGSLDQPEVNGIAWLDGATFSSPALADKIDNVRGNVQFNFDRILVDGLTGRFRQGDIVAMGEIPIFYHGIINMDNPLRVEVKQVGLNLPNLYQGSASADLQIKGSAMEPLVGGKVRLFNGQVLLTDDDTSGQPTGNKQIVANMAENYITLDNLSIELGENILINRPPLLSFRSSGNLTVNGLLTEPIPEGVITLQEGTVNLFTTKFGLSRGYKHTATFRANQPLNPELDIKLSTKVLDIVQSRGDRGRAIENFSGFGGLESVQVEARVQGMASELNQAPTAEGIAPGGGLQLTSIPARTQTEIISLLGGGLATVQDGKNTTLGLINIAGSAVFSNFQSTFNQIGNVLGLTELRIFPTIISKYPEGLEKGTTEATRTPTLELAAEAGVEVSPRFSFSTIKILTADDPFQWGINYNINNQFRVRAASNFENDSRAVVEFQRRF